MTILSDRWKGFRNIPLVALAELPTPIERLDGLSARCRATVWIKRDDLTSARYGGNKVRKLEYVLGDALAHEANTLITAGAAGSHHCLATAIYGADLDMAVHVVLAPQRYSSHAEEHLRALVGTGAHVHPVGGVAGVVAKMATLAARARLGGAKPYVIPPGASNVPGIIGYVEAGLELARQMEAGIAPEPDAVFLPLGTGGTIAGLSIGLAAAGLTSRLIGVRVVPRVAVSHRRVGAMIKQTVRHLRGLDERFPDVAETALALVSIDHAEIGAGYGHPSSAGRNAERLAREHLPAPLEPTYTAKTLASLLRHADGELEGRRLLYLHTLSSADLSARLRDAPPIPTRIQKLLER